MKTKTSSQKDNLDRMTLFVRNLRDLDSDQPVYKAAVLAGYSENYAKAGIYTMMRTSDRFAKFVKAESQHNVKLIQNLYKLNLLSRLYRIDSKVCSEMETDVDKAMKYPKSLDRIAKVSGLMADDPQPGHQVSIGTMINVQALLQSQLSPEVITDGDEVIEHET